MNEQRSKQRGRNQAEASWNTHSHCETERWILCSVVACLEAEMESRRQTMRMEGESGIYEMVGIKYGSANGWRREVGGVCELVA